MNPFRFAPKPREGHSAREEAAGLASDTNTQGVLDALYESRDAEVAIKALLGEDDTGWTITGDSATRDDGAATVEPWNNGCYRYKIPSQNEHGVVETIKEAMRIADQRIADGCIQGAELDADLAAGLTVERSFLTAAEELVALLRSKGAYDAADKRERDAVDEFSSARRIVGAEQERRDEELTRLFAARTPKASALMSKFAERSKQASSVRSLAAIAKERALAIRRALSLVDAGF